VTENRASLPLEPFLGFRFPLPYELAGGL